MTPPIAPLHDPLLDDPISTGDEPTAPLIGGIARSSHYNRPAQRCTCHPPTQGHLYGPALTCLNPGCGATHGDLSPCLHRRRNDKLGHGAVAYVATLHGVGTTP